MYVDDVASGAHTVQGIIKAYQELKNAFASAHMNLRKWCTNSNELRAIIPEDDLELKATIANVKALGISWSTVSDEFTYELKISDRASTLTKRVLFSEIASNL